MPEYGNTVYLYVFMRLKYLFHRVHLRNALEILKAVLMVLSLEKVASIVVNCATPHNLLKNKVETKERRLNTGKLCLFFVVAKCLRKVLRSK